MALMRKIASIDLDLGTVEVSPVMREWREKYIGGWGIATYLLCRDLPSECDGASSDNIVVISAGLLGGTLSVPMGAVVMSSKSPGSGLLGRVALKGGFALEMRQAGWDHLILKGRAEKSVCIEIRDGQIDIRTRAPENEDDRVRKLRVAVDEQKGARLIGPSDVGADVGADAGGDCSDPDGMASILAAKNVQAITCRGTRDIKIKDPEGIIRFESNALRGERNSDQPAGGDTEALYKGVAGPVRRDRLDAVIARCLGYPQDEVRSNGGFRTDDAVERIRLNTGLELDRNMLLDAAYRCVTLERLFNIREGVLTGAEDTSASPEDVRRTVADHYRERGWTKTAVMKKGKVFEPLGIEALWPMFRTP
jgi:aldehyde:ferredoxin oxidoreductase